MKMPSFSFPAGWVLFSAEEFADTKHLFSNADLDLSVFGDSADAAQRLIGDFSGRADDANLMLAARFLEESEIVDADGKKQRTLLLMTAVVSLLEVDESSNEDFRPDLSTLLVALTHDPIGEDGAIVPSDSLLRLPEFRQVGPFEALRLSQLIRIYELVDAVTGFREPISIGVKDTFFIDVREGNQRFEPLVVQFASPNLLNWDQLQDLWSAIVETLNFGT